MSSGEISAGVERLFSAWNSQNAEKVLELFTDDIKFWDAATGQIEGKEYFRGYLLELFYTWKIDKTVLEIMPLADQLGAVVRWDAIYKRRRGERSYQVNGMELIVFSGELINRFEIYFNLGALSQ